ENTLINALFGLLCWPVLFLPLPGAFFHPFHIGPADLTREDFVARRQQAFEQRFRLLDTGAYRREILDTFKNKQGIANPFVFWPVLDEALLELALHCIPSRHLEALFRRLLNNIKEHRSGFPDLIRLVPEADQPEQRYEMIEVKGPGDRLQDHQVRWLQFFARQGIPASVCYVRWQDDEARV
ncbi:MAG: VRR-NUC domain-containing protein, partial [Pseudomonadota bacterium]|nr:VRR-NUC domain-containing protein [Pseudomonadota bacterium]